mgnify:CR=1 FL=1
MTTHKDQMERRRVPRFAFQVRAALGQHRDHRFAVRVIDISTHGCRIELLCGQKLERNGSLYLENLTPQPMRIVWSRDTFAGLEFDTPLHETVLDSLLATKQGAPEPTMAELYDIALRSKGGAERAAPAPVSAELDSLARACAAAALDRLMNHKIGDEGAKV